LQVVDEVADECDKDEEDEDDEEDDDVALHGCGCVVVVWCVMELVEVVVVKLGDLSAVV
jgi:hypothetical protein